MNNEEGKAIAGTLPGPEIKPPKTGKPSMVWGAILFVAGIALVMATTANSTLTVDDIGGYFGALIIPMLVLITGLCWFIVGLMERRALNRTRA